MTYIFGKHEFGHGWPENKRPVDQRIRKRKSRRSHRHRHHRLREYKRCPLCSYCLRPISFENAIMDHMIPSSRGGGSGTNNLTLACKWCDAKKRDNTPLEFLFLGGQKLGG